MQKLIFIISGSLLILGGCTQQAGVKYYWGDYSNTLYTLKKEPSEENEGRHIEELQEIIDVSNERGLRIPPGIQAELGYRYAQNGDMDQARAFFNGETETYPESRYFVERLQQMLGE